MSAMLVNCLFGYKEIEGLWKNNQKEILFLLMGCIDVFSFSFFFFFWLPMNLDVLHWKDALSWKYHVV